jgi:hypothetical protein
MARRGFTIVFTLLGMALVVSIAGLFHSSERHLDAAAGR